MQLYMNAKTQVIWREEIMLYIILATKNWETVNLKIEKELITSIVRMRRGGTGSGSYPMSGFVLLGDNQ